MSTQKAPDISITLASGEKISVAHPGRPLVLFFFPKAFSPVCTAEACAFRQVWPDFGDALVLGINKEAAAELERFRQKHQMPFELISDPNFEIAKAFGVMPLGGLLPITNRVTVVIDAAGNIQGDYSNPLNPLGHPKAALELLAQMQHQDKLSV